MISKEEWQDLQDKAYVLCMRYGLVSVVRALSKTMSELQGMIPEEDAWRVICQRDAGILSEAADRLQCGMDGTRR